MKKHAALISFVLLSVSGCADDDEQPEVIDSFVATLRSSGSIPCQGDMDASTNADAGTLLQTADGKFHVDVRLAAPAFAQGDLRAEVEVLDTGGTNRPKDSFVLLRADAGYEGSTLLTAPGAETVTVRVRVAGEERIATGEFISGRYALDLSVEPRVDAPSLYALKATVRCAQSPEVPVGGVTVLFSAVPAGELLATSARTNAQGIATVLFVPDAGVTQLAVSASAGNARRECVFADGGIADGGCIP